MKSKYTQSKKQAFATRYYFGESAASICTSANIPKSTFYSWLSDFKISSENTKKVINLRDYHKQSLKIQRLENIIQVLKTVRCTNHATLQEKLSELALLHNQYAARILCEALDVDRSTYNNHVYHNKKKNNSYQVRRAELKEKIKQIYDDNSQILGPSKIRAVLVSQGVVVSDKMVKKLMKEMNLFSIRIDAKKQYLKQKPSTKKDVLKLNFKATAPNEVWVSDITYYKLKDKFYYICAIVDLYSRKVVAWKLSLNQSSQLTTSTFKIAYAQRNPSEGLIFHSDRGGAYVSNAFQALLLSNGVTQSFSPTASPQHNAVMESFFANLKKEELYRVQYKGIDNLKKRLQNYMEFYNNERPHSRIQYRTPKAHEDWFYGRQRKENHLDMLVQKS